MANVRDSARQRGTYLCYFSISRESFIRVIHLIKDSTKRIHLIFCMGVLRTVLFLSFLSSLAVGQAVLAGVDSGSAIPKAGDTALLVRLISPSNSDGFAASLSSTSKASESHLTPELALDVYQRRASQQGSD